MIVLITLVNLKMNLPVFGKDIGMGDLDFSIQEYPKEIEFNSNTTIYNLKKILKRAGYYAWMLRGKSKENLLNIMEKHYPFGSKYMIVQKHITQKCYESELMKKSVQELLEISTNKTMRYKEDIVEDIVDNIPYTHPNKYNQNHILKYDIEILIKIYNLTKEIGIYINPSPEEIYIGEKYDLFYDVKLQVFVGNEPDFIISIFKSLGKIIFSLVLI